MTDHPELSALPTEWGGHGGAGDEGVQVPPGDRLDAGRFSACTTNSPSPAPPYTRAEFEALIGSVWSLDDEDPTRFDELLHAALVFIGRVALEEYGEWSGDAAELLRSMEQRALWGPGHPVVQP